MARASVDRIAYAYLTATPEQKETVAQSLQTLLGLLRAQAFSYQTTHRHGSEGVAPSAEGAFFDNPEHREVREFAETGAISNSPAVAADAATLDNMDETPGQAAREAEAAPPTPTDIEAEPGGEQLSTLNRFVVETQEPVPAAVPQNHAELPKHPAIVERVATRWLGGRKVS